MARHPSDSPEQFARAVARAFRREMGDLRMSGRDLGRRIGRSEGYVRTRLDDTFEFSLNDIERFAALLGVSPEQFIATIDGESAVSARDATVTELRPAIDPAVIASDQDIAAKRGRKHTEEP